MGVHFKECHDVTVVSQQFEASFSFYVKEVALVKAFNLNLKTCTSVTLTADLTALPFLTDKQDTSECDLPQFTLTTDSSLLGMITLPVVLYGCETWTLTLREEHRLKVFENKVLRKIFGAKRDEVTGEWRKLHNAELHTLYSSPDIIRNIKSRRLRWAGHVAHMGESRNAYRVLVGRPEGKRPLRRPRRRWEDNIKMDLREVGYNDREWINLAQDRDRWRAYVRAAMNLRYAALSPSHFLQSVTRHLNRQYGERWIGRGGPAPRSPDLNPLDFCVCDYAKSLVYTTDVTTPEELLHRIVDAFQQMKNDPGLLESILGSLQGRLDRCIQVPGQHLAHLL
ncbi:hypothetical protein ANN_00073 [Periplaneta americana]|uniref:Uncharacterized protein n=1 Tax=Periplaneta americana TaxID=6978 RepID=A0ABQ8TS52_PERAM|nr:hypothetical protein ANN_00073 [Periplaneta americana]